MEKLEALNRSTELVLENSRLKAELERLRGDLDEQEKYLLLVYAHGMMTTFDIEVAFRRIRSGDASITVASDSPR